MRARRIRLTFWTSLLAVFACLVAGCTIGDRQNNNEAGAPSAQPKPTSVAKITVSPGSSSAPINPTTPVTVDVAQGKLTSVTMTNPDGKVVDGITTPDSLHWKTGEVLGYSKTYDLVVKAVDVNGLPTTTKTTVETIKPSNQTQLSLTMTNGNAIQDGATYGVGTVIVAHFDEPIRDRAAAQKLLTVTTDPQLEGQWNWFDNQNAHWRPKEFYPSGTKVTVSAKLYGKDLGGGLFGQSDVQTSFNIGPSHISVADDNTKTVTVKENGEVVRTMPTSMGRGGSEVVDGQTISFWTPSGTYTVMGKANPVIMDSSTYGLPINSRLGYKEEINWATRISPDGIYLHQLDSTVWAQGNTNTSHGCLNLNESNAQWFYNFSRPGDVVQVVNTGGPGQSEWNNGDWTVPWSEWVQGSAV